jgi:hypothetical protein
VDRLFLTRQFSHQRSAEPAPSPVQVPGQQRQNEQIQRVHHHAEPVRAAGEQHQLRQTQRVIQHGGPVPVPRQQHQIEQTQRVIHHSEPVLGSERRQTQHHQIDPVFRGDRGVRPIQRDQAQAEHQQFITRLIPALMICGVCFDDITNTNQLSRNISPTCSHVRDVICRPCLELHITSQAALQNWDSITCPQVGCETVLSHADLQIFASVEVFERYDISTSRRVVEADPDFVPCPNPRCSSGGLVDAQSSLIFECSSCNSITCLKCKTADHPGLSHGQNLRSTALRNARTASNKWQDEQATQELIGRIAKPCPNTHCGVNVQKDGGCDHMTCRACRHEFCWDFMADWAQIRRNGNRGHNRGCALYGRNDFLVFGEIA